ncbi:MAG: SP_1767 family glycosyltransferase [Clostridia bacterium]|nr:SP_1767 family glycosyltransferase [Clostridia bacterium]
MLDAEILNRKEILLKKMEEEKINILSIEDSINKISKERKSIVRFGDGELDLILGRPLKFQKCDEKLAKRLSEILLSRQDKCLIGIPDVLARFENLTEESEMFWIRNMERTRETWLKHIDRNIEYCTANLTRLYIRHKDRSKCGTYFSMLKEIWKDKDVLICEGKQTRIGVGNDLLSEAKTVRRILCPSENAFDKYDEIIDCIRKESKDAIILLALGPTATVLAYDLAMEGYHALDLGHFDIEYEWFLRSANKKEKIENKYVNEVSNGNNTVEIFDEKYKNEIIKIIDNVEGV